MRWLILILCCGTFSLLSSQESLLEGFVRDADTKAPIPYVNLSILNTLKGTSTDEKGHFYFDVPEAFLQKQVHISALGYEDHVTLVGNLLDGGSIYLNEAVFELEEVVIADELGNSEILNPISSYSVTSGFTSSATPWVLALYFPNIGERQKLLDKVMIYFQQTDNSERKAAKFRLRIYGVDPDTGTPGIDLLRESLVLNTPDSAAHITVDLSEYQIVTPRDGVYVGVEWLFIPSNWYRSVRTDPISKEKFVEDRFAPTFGGVYSSNFNYKTMIYGMGSWNPFGVVSREGNKTFVPAISLKLAIR